MKRGIIFGVLVAAVAASIIISTFKGASRYVDFERAQAMNEGRSRPAVVHVIGHLPFNKQGQIMGLEEAPDRLSFQFSLLDAKGKQMQVHYNQPVPVDFARAEQVVIVGYATEKHFQAERILLKCPSKYEASPPL